MDEFNHGFPHSQLFSLDFIIFEVEGTLFKVPRCSFEGRPGTPFEVATSISGQIQSSGPTPELEGLTDTKPVHLPQIKKVEFESLLKVMYPQLLHSAPLSEKLVRSLVRKEWIHVLKLSTMWGLDDIRQMAIEKLSTGFGSDPIEKILLAKRYGVSSWLLDGYAQLVSQQAPLQMETLDSLDWKTKVSLLSLRDRYPPAVYGDAQFIDHDSEGSAPSMVICNKCKSKNNGGAGFDKLEVLKETFAGELADMS